tara:strand:- start:153 stop:1091 length:939 start_codon:yes stop_codon:yes gene_type:complete
MGYIGKSPTVGAFQKCDAITVVNGQAAYTLQVGSANVSPESVNHMIVSLNGVIQAPTTAYTVSGATLTFDSNLATGDVIDFVLLLGNVLDIGTPSDNTVATAKIQDDAVTLAKMAAGTDGNIISYDASGNPVAIATGSDGQVLTSAGAGQPPAFEAISAGISNADTWRVTTNFTDVANPIASNWEQTDTGGQSALGSSMTQSSGIFTFPSTGFWLVQFAAKHLNSSDADYHKDHIEVTTNNSSYAAVTELWGNLEPQEYNTTFGMAIIDVTSTTNVKVRFCVAAADQAANMTTYGDTNINATYATFIRLGDT